MKHPDSSISISVKWGSVYLPRHEDREGKTGCSVLVYYSIMLVAVVVPLRWW